MNMDHLFKLFSKPLLLVHYLFSYFFLFSLPVLSNDWLPDGMIVDKSGNIVHSVELDSQFTGPKESLTTLAYVATIDQGMSIINLSKPEFFKNIKKYDPKGVPPNDGSGFIVTKNFKIDVPSTPLDFLGETVSAFSIGSVFPTVVAPQIGLMISVRTGLAGRVFVKRYDQIKKLPVLLKIPDSQKALDKYSIGDSFLSLIHI